MSDDPQLNELMRDAIENARREYEAMGLNADEVLAEYGVAPPVQKAEDAEQAGAGEAAAQEQAQPQPAEGQAQEPPRIPGLFIDPLNPYASLRQLVEQNPAVLQAVRTLAGRERAREERKRIAELEAELERLKAERARILVESVPEQERQQLAQSDERFKQLLEDASRDVPDPSEALEEVELQSALDDVFDRFRGVIPDWRLDQYMAAIQPGGCQNCSAFGGDPHGILDHDERGREVSPVAAIIRLQDMLDREALPVRLAQRSTAAAAAPAAAQGQAAAPASAQQLQQSTPEQAPRPTPSGVARAVEEMRNPRLAANPDVSDTRAVASAARRPVTIEEFSAMPIEEVLARWPNPGDTIRAVQSGEIILG